MIGNEVGVGHDGVEEVQLSPLFADLVVLILFGVLEKGGGIVRLQPAPALDRLGQVSGGGRPGGCAPEVGHVGQGAVRSRGQGIDRNHIVVHEPEPDGGFDLATGGLDLGEFNKLGFDASIHSWWRPYRRVGDFQMRLSSRIAARLPSSAAGG